MSTITQLYPKILRYIGKLKEGLIEEGGEVSEIFRGDIGCQLINCYNCCLNAHCRTYEFIRTNRGEVILWLTEAIIILEHELDSFENIHLGLE